MERINEEFNYMKSRFSMQFMAKVEKTLQQITGIQYDVEVVKMNAMQFAHKKDTDALDIKLGNYTLKSRFERLEE